MNVLMIMLIVNICVLMNEDHTIVHVVMATQLDLIDSSVLVSALTLLLYYSNYKSF